VEKHRPQKHRPQKHRPEKHRPGTRDRAATRDPLRLTGLRREDFDNALQQSATVAGVWQDKTRGITRQTTGGYIKAAILSPSPARVAAIPGANHGNGAIAHEA